MNMFKTIETTTINQSPNLKIEAERKEGETYLSYKLSEFVQELADLTGKSVQVLMTQTIIVDPRPKEPSNET